MFSVTYSTKKATYVKKFETEEEAENFKNIISSLPGFQIIGENEAPKTDYKIEWPRV